MSETEERKLSKAEVKRKDTFEGIKQELESEGYQVREITMSTLVANIITFLGAAPFIILFIVLFMLINPGIEWRVETGIENKILFLLLFFVLIVIHELIHGLTWGLCAKNKFKSIEFGVIWQYLTPYCTCCEPLKKYQMVLGCLMPTIVLGIVPGIVAIICGSVWMLFMVCLMILGGGADIVIATRILLSHASKKALYYDHPTVVGTVIFDKKD